MKEARQRLLANDRAGIGLAEQALQLADELGWLTLRAEAHEQLAWAHHHVTGVFETALRHIFMALNLRIGSANPAGEARVRVMYAQVLLALGQPDSALDQAVAARRLAEARPQLPLLATVNNALGLIHRAMKQLHQAELSFQLAAEQAEQAGDNATLALAACNIGRLHSEQGERAPATAQGAQHFRAAIALYERAAVAAGLAGDARLSASARRSIALAHAHRGEFAAAHALLDEQLLHARRTDDSGSEEQSLRLKGLAFLHENRPGDALAVLQAAVAIATRTQRVESEMLARQLMSRACERLADLPAALHHFRRYHDLHAQRVADKHERRLAALAVQFQTERARAEAAAAARRAAVLAFSNEALQPKAARPPAVTPEGPLTRLSNRRRGDIDERL